MNKGFLNTFSLCFSFSPYFPSPIDVLARISLQCYFLTFEFSTTTSCKYALPILSGQLVYTSKLEIKTR
jgi:hypothetical protein